MGEMGEGGYKFIKNKIKSINQPINKTEEGNQGKKKKRLIPGRETIFSAKTRHLLLQQIICTLTNDAFYM